MLMQNKPSVPELLQLLTEQERETSLIIGFDKGHTYVWYNGYRLDTRGHGGIRVKTEIRRSNRIYGNAFREDCIFLKI